MTRWLKRLAVVLLIVAAIVALRITAFRPDPVPVTVFVVAPGLIEAIVTNSRAGTVRTRRRAALGPEVGGRIAELAVRAGERVEQGALLLRLANADLRAQVVLQERSLEAARATRREACVTAQQAVRDLNRTKELERQQVVSASVLETARWKVDSTRAACEAGGANERQAQAALEVAIATFTKTELHAPFPGVIAELRAEVGEWVTPSPPAMMVPGIIDLIDTDSIYISAPLDEVDAGKVHAGQTVRVTIDPYPDTDFAGRVTRVAPYVADEQEQNRTFEIEVELDDQGAARRLLPGTTADVEVILEAREGALRLPSYALLEDGKVLVVRDGVLVEAAVEAGLRNWQFVEIRSGLEQGERVVTSLDREEVKAGARATVSGETLK